MVLAMAPAGIAEMVLTGKVLGLDSTMIAGFQLMRIIIVLIWCRTALVLFQRSRGTRLRHAARPVLILRSARVSKDGTGWDGLMLRDASQRKPCLWKLRRLAALRCSSA